MNTAYVEEAESVTRSIARWGSAAAAIVFGVAFATDRSLNWDFFSGQSAHIGLTVVIFAGYALALTKQFEVLGSAIARLAIVGLYLYGLLPSVQAPNAIFLAVGAPALFHLVAVALHRYVLHHSHR